MTVLPAIFFNASSYTCCCFSNGISANRFRLASRLLGCTSNSSMIALSAAPVAYLHLWLSSGSLVAWPPVLGFPLAGGWGLGFSSPWCRFPCPCLGLAACGLRLAGDLDPPWPGSGQPQRCEKEVKWADRVPPPTHVKPKTPTNQPQGRHVACGTSQRNCFQF